MQAADNKADPRAWPTCPTCGNRPEKVAIVKFHEEGLRADENPHRDGYSFHPAAPIPPEGDRVFALCPACAQPHLVDDQGRTEPVTRDQLLLMSDREVQLYYGAKQGVLSACLGCVLHERLLADSPIITCFADYAAYMRGLLTVDVPAAGGTVCLLCGSPDAARLGLPSDIVCGGCGLIYYLSRDGDSVHRSPAPPPAPLTDRDFDLSRLRRAASDTFGYKPDPRFAERSAAAHKLMREKYGDDLRSE